MDYKIININKGSIGGKPIRYISNGKGKDSYITYNYGGMVRDAPVLNGSQSSGIVNKRYYNLE